MILALVPLAGGPLPASGASAGGAGCGSSAFVSRLENPPVDLFPADTTVLTTVIHHLCLGPIAVEAMVSAGLTPTALEDAFVTGFASLTCSGGGCPVTGLPIVSDLVGDTGLTLDKTRPFEFQSVVFAGVFTDMPAGLYIVDVVVSGQRASLITGHLHVVGSGTAAAGGRPPAP